MKKIREVLLKAAPGARESISYNMPCLKDNKVLVYYGAASTHLGFYPMPSAIEAFRKELTDYKTSKGTVQFPYAEPLPVKLIADIIRFRLEEDHLKSDVLPQNLSNPAKRALERAGIKTLRQLAKKTEDEILQLHGVGPASMPTLREALAAQKLAFKSAKKV